ncbi:hypothetical protein ACO0RG_000394 [Hanseniaspora osmophila]|uniref:tRNA-specific adenosine deaminase 1 n=1 Tax=Hanseniaspora osmophila TaxID=56408 RepID=A0A1E5R1W1_9ASCO|nr:tRNA-specific adenosine deaminase 1 [Hanseniaspora osmophila]
MLVMNANDIAELVYKEYAKSFKPICKPVVKSNGIKEWTVLAAVVGYDTVAKAFQVVSMATGVKVTPDTHLSRSMGKILHDCHAEILAIRGFNAVLHDQLRRYNSIKDKTELYLIEKSASTNSFRVGEKWAFYLYISEIPCGDSSMNEAIESRDRGENDKQQELIFHDSDLIQYVDPKVRTVLRGRFNYSKKGFVRTKPGRADSNMSLSKSCSDKLCMKQVTSLNNAITYFLLDSPVYLSGLVIPNLNRSKMEALVKSFQRPGKLIAHPVEFLTTDLPFQDQKLQEEQTPSSMSGILLFLQKNKTPKQEAILNGIKNGYFVKGNKPLRKNCESLLSRYHQWSIFEQSNYFHSYLSFKKSLHKRNDLVRKLRDQLSSEGWIHTCSDDCHAQKV